MMMHKEPFKRYVNVLDHNIAIMHPHIHILNDLASLSQKKCLNL